MASQTEPHRTHHHHHQPFPRFIHSTAAALLSLLPLSKPAPIKSSIAPPPPRICLPVTSSRFDPTDSSSSSSSSVTSSLQGVSSHSGTGFPSTVRISSLNPNGGGGPAFVGQVFSMCDLSGTGLMAVSTHFDVPFISKRTPEWLKKMFSVITKSERSGPVFRFFMDLGDAVTYVKKLNIRSGVVGACRLDIAYEHFKEKPHLFQFIPSEKQVKAANKLLKTLPKDRRPRKVEGVPVFSAQNLDIAIATSDGIKWYTPYFFDKNMLDNILEGSVDQHFQGLIQSRHMQRRRDVIDDSMAGGMAEDITENIWEPPEVQEVLDEMGPPSIPLSVITKAAEIELLYAVDRVLLGNRWLRKATGIQPKFPYMLDSFERRSAASLLRASATADPRIEGGDFDSKLVGVSSPDIKSDQVDQFHQNVLRLPFSDWFDHAWSKQHQPKPETRNYEEQAELKQSPFLPKITMVGISTGEAGQMSKSTLKKTMEDLTKELEVDQSSSNGNSDSAASESRDPLFVANVGDFYSGVAKTGSPRWVRGGND
uniref:Tic22-like family protein n=2 Tax=Kalanchoe fedtschenkoi TaxID=63787 RepID=A0A7N0V2F7_KALFE